MSFWNNRALKRLQGSAILNVRQLGSGPKPRLPQPQARPTPDPKSRRNTVTVPTSAIWTTLGVLGTGGFLYWSFSTAYKEITLFSGEPAHIRSIPSTAVELKYVGDLSKPDAPPIVRKHRLLDGEEAEAMLHNEEIEIEVIGREGNPVHAAEVNRLLSGTSGEDRWCFDVVTRGALADLAKYKKAGFFWQRWWHTRNNIISQNGITSTCGDGGEDIIIASVWDGHCSEAVAELLKKTLHGCLAWNIGSEYAKMDSSWWDTVIGRVSGGGETQQLVGSAAWTPDFFSDIISKTFVALDDDLCQTTSKLLFSPPSNTTSPLLPPHLPSLLTNASPIHSGSCSLNAIVDVAADKLFVANVGDTRAIAGWWNPREGKWRCDVLTNDAMGDNPVEAQRVIDEHPEDEAETAMFDDGKGNGRRVLGGLQITRSFGDEDYKLDHEEWKEINRAVGQQVPRRKWRWFDECPSKTPPYITAEPEVVWRDLHPDNGEELKFVLLATDGLWDRMTSEEASLLLASHLAAQHSPDVPKDLLPSIFPHTPSLPEDQHPFPKEELATTGSWVFEDDNAATHLVRNSLGGGDRVLRKQFLSMRSPGVRAIRDDITALVLWFDEAKATAKAENWTPLPVSNSRITLAQLETRS
ncbi:hypothetical protein IAT38_003412 [Cryptococcus sp. DSM 104549]